MTQNPESKKLVPDLLQSIDPRGIADPLSNLLIKNTVDFEAEFNELYIEGLASSYWQHLDQTSARVKGVNYTTNVVCNPLYTIYSTTLKKDRLSVLRVLQKKQGLEFIRLGAYL